MFVWFLGFYNYKRWDLLFLFYREVNGDIKRGEIIWDLEKVVFYFSVFVCREGKDGWKG